MVDVKFKLDEHSLKAVEKLKEENFRAEIDRQSAILFPNKHEKKPTFAEWCIGILGAILFYVVLFLILILMNGCVSRNTNSADDRVYTTRELMRLNGGNYYEFEIKEGE